MTEHIPESDWRQFKRLHAELLERFSARVLDELAAILQGGVGTAHEKYGRAYQLLRTRDKELARAFDDYRRSTALLQLAIMRRLGLLTDQDLNAFSSETQDQLRGITAWDDPGPPPPPR